MEVSNEICYDTHDIVKKGWDDGSRSITLKASVSGGQQIMVLHTQELMRARLLSVYTTYPKTLVIHKQICMINWIKTFLKFGFRIHCYGLYHQIESTLLFRIMLVILNVVIKISLTILIID